MNNFYSVFNHPFLFKRLFGGINSFHTRSCIMEKTKSKNTQSAKNNTRFPPGEIYLCVLGNGSLSSPRSLYMFTDHERYLFNCGEGTQRLAHEHRMKISKLNHIFITQNNWENVGGLLGLSLTAQDSGVSKLTVHGPSNTDTLFSQSNSFVYLNNLEIVTKEPSDEPFSDSCMTVNYIPIHKSCLKERTLVNTLSQPKKKKLKLSTDSPPDHVVSYACKGHSKAGQLLFSKCVEYGVPTGPLLAELKSGKDVVLPSGRKILSKDVVSPEQVCPIFLVVDCPSEAFLDSFVSEHKFSRYQTGGCEQASLVAHFTPSRIVRTEAYQTWMKKFSGTHLLMNEQCGSLNSLAVHRIQHKLHLLQPTIFPLLNEREEIDEFKSENIVQARTLDRYFLRPDRGFDRSVSLTLNPEEFVEEVNNTDGFKESLFKFKESIAQLPETITQSERHPEVVFLGTGSCIPSKVRNVSAVLVHMSEQECVLLDCGEGTYGQICRMCSVDVLSRLQGIFISHMHADHHLGLVKILLEREALCGRGDPVIIVGPNNLEIWLDSYFQNFESVKPEYLFVDCASLVDHFSFLKEKKNTETNFGSISISTVTVPHCPYAYAAILSHPQWKMVYSGDTMPCDSLVKAGKNCSLLIHEATMEDELADEAVIKRHSTTSQAIHIGEEMGAKYTILTHFSQRYAKVPLFNESFHNRVGCAFDNMRVPFSKLHILPLLIPVLKTMFAEEVEELHTKVHKRRLKKEVKKSVLDDLTIPCEI